MTETVVFSLLFAWFKGYKWSEILKPFKHWSAYLIILTFCIHIYIVYSIMHESYWILEYAGLIKIISLLFYFVLIFHYKLIDVSVFKKINKSKKQGIISLTSPVAIGGLFVVIGSKLNRLAMLHNGDKMPVFISNSWATGYAKKDMFLKAEKYNDFHTMGNEYTKMIPLTDTWDFGFCSMSLGDLLIRVFVVLIIYYTIKQANEPKIIVDK